MNSSESTDALLAVDDLAIGYDVTLQQHLSLQVRPGDIIRINGANGSGKTTFLRTLLRHISPRGGRVTYKVSEQIGSSIAYVPQNAHNTLLPWFDSFDNILLGALHTHQLTTSPAFQRVAAAFAQNQHATTSTADLLRAWSGVNVTTRSGGQRQRISLLRAFVAAPRLAFLDEPYLELDAAASTAFTTFLLEYVAEMNGAILYISHHDVPLPATQEVTLS